MQADSLGQSKDAKSGTPGWLAICYLVFFFSGTAGLMYQISWSRQFGLLFGHTIQVASIVLAAYFAGMAFGCFIGGGPASRFSPLKAYAVAEITVAAWACAIPAILDYVELSSLLVHLTDSQPKIQTALRSLFCFFLLLPATTALGATLPLISRLLALSKYESVAAKTSQARVTAAYALNTAGALLGVVSATFYFLVEVGVRSTGYMAALISVACAVVAYVTNWVQRRSPQVEEARVSDDCRRSRFTTSMLLAAASGIGTLGLEILYVRLFSLVFHNSTYTFGAVTAAYLAALALGAALVSRIRQRYDFALGCITSVGALLTLLSVLFFVQLTGLRYFSFGDTFAMYLVGVLVLVGLVVVPPVTLLGMSLPLVWKRSALVGDFGTTIGRLTAVNSLAAGAGVVIVNFVLLPTLGLWASFVTVALLFLVTGAVLLACEARTSAVLSVAGLTIVACAALIVSNPLDLSSIRTGEEVVRRWESSYGLIDVVRTAPAGTFKVRQNLHYRFGETVGDSREARQTSIPVLLHKDPQDVLFLGLGTGLTAGAAVPLRDVKRIVAIELIPDVVEAARYLQDYNHRIVDHPKAEIYQDDARHYLVSTDRNFDVIVSDLFVPWESESGYLFTVDHYLAGRQRLKAGGLFCQWVALYQVGPREFEMIADSFAEVFPSVSIWWGAISSQKPVVALIGTPLPITIQLDELDRRLSQLHRDFASIDGELMTVDAFLDHYEGDWLRRPGRALNTDEHPRIEFLAPITNRERKLISGATLNGYYSSTLSRLPTSPLLTGESLTEAKQKAAQRRAWRQVILSAGAN